jgi:Peptidase A4 family
MLEGLFSVFRARLTVSALLALAVPAIALAATPGQSQASAAPATTSPLSRVVMDGSSPNWAGYVAYGTKFRYVQATFEVPRLNCHQTPGTGIPAMASAWVGLDGAGSRTVEQDGILGECSHGAASYYAWWETYPKAPVSPSWHISVGDIISASVWYDSAVGKYRLDLADQTKGESFSDWERCGTSSCSDASAEVITESPGESWSPSYYPLADWGTSSYWNVSITDAAGQRGGYDSRAWHTTGVDMYGREHLLKTVTGGLSAGGTEFHTYWERKI